MCNLRNDFSTKNFEKSFEGFLLPPNTTSSPRPPLEYSHRAKIKIRPRPSRESFPMEEGEEGSLHTLPSRERFLSMIKFQEE